jgi:2-amino-4-hydroxy-6-hydroxymethyldihydropteridine diphosphokinase
MMNTAILLSGSNMGDRLEHLRMAKDYLPAAGCVLLAESSIYETAAWGNQEQPVFLNQAWQVTTQKEPIDLLASLLEIEKAMGRRRLQKWESRIIDIDILFYDQVVYRSENLVLPHPHLHERKFALMPVAEILPQWMHPVFHKTVNTLLQEVNDPLQVTKYVIG